MLGALEVYRNGNLFYSLNSRFLNILGSFYIPLDQWSGSISDSRLTEGEPVAFAVWKPREGYYENRYMSIWRVEPTFEFNGSTLNWHFDGSYRFLLMYTLSGSTAVTEYPDVGGFDVYYGVM